MKHSSHSPPPATRPTAPSPPEPHQTTAQFSSLLRELAQPKPAETRDEPPSLTPHSSAPATLSECALNRSPRPAPECAECRGYRLTQGAAHIKAQLCPCVLNCPECLGIGFHHDDATAKSNYCQKIAPQKIVSLYNNSDLPLRYLKAHFASAAGGFRNYSGNADQVLSRIHGYINTFAPKHESPHHENKGLVLSGPVGVGKTYLLVCIAKQLIEKGYGVKFVDFFRMSSEVQAGLVKKQSPLEILDPLIDVDILLIDELGKGRNSQFELTIIDQIIMGRYNQNKPIIATTNYLLTNHTGPAHLVDLKASTDAFSSDDFTSLAGRLGSRIFSRLMESTHFIELQGSDYRTMIHEPLNQRHQQ